MPLFIPDLRDQHRPGQPGFDAFDVTVASAEFPSGASWLASCLLELGVPVWKPWGTDDRASWQHLGGRAWRYSYEGSGWSRLVPGLVDGRSLRLRHQPVPQFTHAFPGQLPLAPKLVLFVRDPRDTLLSECTRRQRVSGRELSIERFLTEPIDGWQISPAAYLGCFLGMWLAVAEQHPTLVVRFEDSKRDPSRTLQRVLSFLGMEVPARRRAHAIAASTHARIVAAEQRLIAAGVVPTPILGAGRVLAHRGTDVRLPPVLARIAVRLGYDSMDSACTRTPGGIEREVIERLRTRLGDNAADVALLDRCLASCEIA